jgi:hypothetical protein
VDGESGWLAIAPNPQTTKTPSGLSGW